MNNRDRTQTGHISFESDSSSDFIRFIADQKNIRALLDYAGGTGNEASTLNVLSRLRAMGFQGKFEIIYPDHGKEKLPRLFGISSDVPPVYTYEDQTLKDITLISYSEHVKRLDANKVELVDLAITGAYDSEYIPECKRNKELQCYDRHRNFAKFTNSKVFVLINPWYRNGNSPPAFDEIYTLNSDNVQTFIEARKKFFKFPTATLEEARSYLVHEPAGLEYATKILAINTLIDGIEEKTFNILPVYGAYFSTKYHGKYFLANILQVIAGARYAQIYGPPELRHKPFVIPVFYDYKYEITELERVIQESDWRSHPDLDQSNVTSILKELDIPHVLSTALLADAKTSERLTDMKDNTILLLSVGNIPNKNLFDALYNHFPAVREGQGSLNSMIVSGKGKPHLRCTSNFLNKWELGSDYLSNPLARDYLEQLYNAETGFCAPHVWQNNPKIYQIVGQFLIDSQIPDSTISLYFSNLYLEASRLENDRIRNALFVAMQILNNPKQITSASNQHTSAMVMRFSENPKYSFLNSPLIHILGDSSPMHISDKPTDLPTFTFTKAGWDPEIKYDDYTRMPIFTFRIHDNENEIGSIEFYGQPLFCVASDKTRNNIVKATGVLNTPGLTDKISISEVCQILPPSLLDKVIVNVTNGALLGGLIGGTNVIEARLNSHGMPSQFSNYITNFIYYGCYFNIKLHYHLSQLPSDEDSNHFLNAAYQAAWDTGQLWFTRMSLQIFSKSCYQLGDYLRKKNYPSVVSNGVNTTGALVNFGIFAKSAVENGVVETTSAILAGTATQKLIENYGMPKQDRYNNNDRKRCYVM